MDKLLSKLNKDELLNELEKWFSNDSSWDSEWRDNAKVWYDYYHGRHWTSEEIEALQERGQAVTTYNHIKPAIDSVIGSERQNRPKVTMAARTLDDGTLAEAKSKLYDYICYNTRSDDEVDKMVLDAFVTGKGWIYVAPEFEKDKDNTDIYHSYIDYRDVFIDALSKVGMLLVNGICIFDLILLFLLRSLPLYILNTTKPLFFLSLKKKKCKSGKRPEPRGKSDYGILDTTRALVYIHCKQTLKKRHTG